MNILISILYAPLVFMSLRYFDIKITAISIFFVTLIWLFFSLKKGFKESLYPITYILIALLAFIFEDFIVLKILPMLISAVISSIILISYLNKTSIILYFAKKFSKKEISIQEQAYIQRSSLFWFFIGLINTLTHLYIFLDDNINFWIFYSSIGWYSLFIGAGILQFLHRKFIFLRSCDV